MNSATTHRADLLIVGAGPAGLMAAIAAAELGRRVLVCERLDRPAVKLLATGGGRCNLTITKSIAEIMASFGRQGRFMTAALHDLDPQGLRDLLAGLGVPTVADEVGRVYPASQSAATVRTALLARCGALGVEMRTDQAVSGLWLEGDRLRGLETGPGRLAGERVVVAAGGLSYPDLGATGVGYTLARQAGHEIVPPTPALVGLLTAEGWAHRCPGVSLEHVRVWIDLPGQSRKGITGDVLFTHRGLSGPAVLDLSGEVARLLADRPAVPLCLDLTRPAPGEPVNLPPEPRWQQRFDRWRRRQGSRTIGNLLAQHLPRALSELLCEQTQTPPQTRAAELPVPHREHLIDMLTALPLTATGTEGFARAIVTRGGVSLREIDARTLQSRHLAGLFFAGEVLDLDGPTGGYNLQWAFSSGWLAGASAGA